MTYRKHLALLGAISLTLAACGSGSESASDAGETQAETTAAEATTTAAPDTTVAEPADDTTDDTTEETTDDTAEPEPMGVREPLTLTPITAGPITVTPSVCTVEGAELEGSNGAESIAFAGERLFITNDTGLLAFNFSGPDCTLTLDTAIGTNGVLSDDEHLQYLSGTPDGRLAATGVLGSMVYDIEPGFSYECDMTGYVTLSPDGTTAIMSFPGREASEVWTLSDTNCTETGTIDFAGVNDLKFVTYDGGDYLVGGENENEDTIAVRHRNGAPVWTAGGGETGADNWFGWVHGMAPCGNFTCMIDTNTDALALIGSDGAVAANFDFSDLIGIRGWIEPMIVGPDGAVYVLFSDAVDDENDVRSYFDSIIRLDVTG